MWAGRPIPRTFARGPNPLYVSKERATFMARLRSTITPASAPGGHVWDDETTVVEVEDELATVLLRIPDAGFVEVLPDTKRRRTRNREDELGE